MFMSMSKVNREKIPLAEFISKNLLLRSSADELFNYINNLELNDIIIDFNTVQAITRAFTHQYLSNKKKCQKKITDINLSPQIRNMFEIIEKTSNSR